MLTKNSKTIQKETFSELVSFIKKDTPVDLLKHWQIQGSAKDARSLGPNCYIFMQFWGKLGKMIGLAPPPLRLTPPPPRNPGSATLRINTCHQFCIPLDSDVTDDSTYWYKYVDHNALGNRCHTTGETEELIASRVEVKNPPSLWNPWQSLSIVQSVTRRRPSCEQYLKWSILNP